MPVAVSHSEKAVVKLGDHAIIVGGQFGRDSYTELIQAYDAVKDVWEVIGTLPYPLKGHSAVVNNGWLYFFCGQKSKLPSGREPGAIINSGWRARVSDLKS